MKVFGPNGRHEATFSENFSIESPVFVTSRPPPCSNNATQVFLPNFSANSKLQFFFSDISGHFLITFHIIIFFSLPYTKSEDQIEKPGRKAGTKSQAEKPEQKARAKRWDEKLPNWKKV